MNDSLRDTNSEPWTLLFDSLPTEPPPLHLPFTIKRVFLSTPLLKLFVQQTGLFVLEAIGPDKTRQTKIIYGAGAIVPSSYLTLKGFIHNYISVID